MGCVGFRRCPIGGRFGLCIGVRYREPCVRVLAPGSGEHRVFVIAGCRSNPFRRWSNAPEVCVCADETLGGLISGGICVVSAGDVLELEGVDPWWYARREAGGGEEEVDVLHAGEFEGGECVDGTFDDEGGSGAASGGQSRTRPWFCVNRAPCRGRGAAGGVPSSSAPAGLVSASRVMKTA